MLRVGHDKTLRHSLVDHPILVLQHSLQPNVLVVLTKRTKDLQVTASVKAVLSPRTVKAVHVGRLALDYSLSLDCILVDPLCCLDLNFCLVPLLSLFFGG